MIDAIASLFGGVIRLLYNVLGGNFGLSIILFSIIVKFITFPLMYKQTKSMKEIEKIAPIEAEIRKKYKDNPEKMNMKLMDLYTQHKINPLGGCLPLLIQLPIILAMFYIVRQPLTYIKQMPVKEIRPYAEKIVATELKAAGKNEKQIQEQIKKLNDKVIRNYEIQVANENKLIDMNFAGINFGDVPSKNLKNKPYLLIIPFLTLALGIYQNKRMMKKSNMTPEQLEMQKTMMWMSPIMSTYISYIMPVALGVYWFLGGVIQLIQQEILDYKFNVTPKHDLLNKGGDK